ncbi:MAG: Mur ligase family protein [Bacillota bacterium]
MEPTNLISGVACDSRQVKPGDAFVAIKGFADDGNRYIDQAINRGAKVIYTEEEITKEEVEVVQVDNARQTLAQLANQLYDYPSHKLNLVGVTGTNGKTTTSHLIETLFSTVGAETGLIGTVKTKIGNYVHDPTLTTPQPIEIYDYLAQMVGLEVDLAVMEVSSHGIKLDRIAGLDFDLVIHTNITADHFDLHQDFADYLATKHSFFTQCGADKYALINLDDQYAAELMSNLQAEVVTYGFSQAADIRISDFELNRCGSKFKVQLAQQLERIDGRLIEPQEFTIELNLLGKHNIYNGLATVAAGLLYGLESEEIQQGLQACQPFFRRLEVIYDQQFTIIDDCAHNPGNYQAVFATIKNLEYENLYIINAIRGNRGVRINQENARVIGEAISELSQAELLVTSCQKLAGESDTVLDRERDRFIATLNQKNIKFIYDDYLEVCLKQVLNKVGENDLILLLGAHAMDQAGQLILDLIE